MNQLNTLGLVLARTDFGEADRILTVLTPHYGKLRLLAKGVRRVKSKLAGGIELFSVSELTFIRGRSDIGTLVSSRLKRHYAHIVQDLDRTMLGYELIKQLNKLTEDEAEPAYFELVEQLFVALDVAHIPPALIRFWFDTQLLRLGGHTPNLQRDGAGAPLDSNKTYNFNFDNMSFAPNERGRWDARHIKFLRLVFAGTSPKLLVSVRGGEELAAELQPLVATIFSSL